MTENYERELLKAKHIFRNEIKTAEDEKAFEKGFRYGYERGKISRGL